MLHVLPSYLSLTSDEDGLVFHPPRETSLPSEVQALSHSLRCRSWDPDSLGSSQEGCDYPHYTIDRQSLPDLSKANWS